MIDLATEQVLSLQDAALRLPRLRGKPLHCSTLHRWSTRGIRGVRLEVVHLGATRVTSVEAVQRFIVALSATRLPDRSEACDVADGSATQPATPGTALQ